MHSIRSRLILVLGCSLGLLLLGAGVLLYTVLWTQLVREFDKALLVEAQALMTLTEDEGGRVEFEYTHEVMPELALPHGPAYFELWLATGALITRSPSLGAANLPRLTHLTSIPLFRDIELPDSRHGRLLQVAFVPRQDTYGIGTAQGEDRGGASLDPTLFPHRAVVLVLARDRMHLDALMQSLQFALGVAVLVLLVVLVALVGLALTIGLRPLDDIKRQVATLDALSLHSSIQVQTYTRELAPVVDQLNALLRRLDAAFARERRFSRDVAHELRTPVAELRTLADVARRWPDDQQAISEYFRDVQDIALQMERIVVALLALARCESGMQMPQKSTVNLREMVEISWRTIAREARAKGVALVCDVPSSLSIETDRDMFIIVLNNLFSNAVTYSPPHHQVRCTAMLHAERVRLSISNRTDTLTPEDLPHLFERFWRKDPARAASHHTGLGLSVVKGFADVLALEVDGSLDGHRRFHVTVSV
jgi:two-component system sensor histidine kinase QseC